MVHLKVVNFMLHELHFKEREREREVQLELRVLWKGQAGLTDDTGSY